MTQELVGLYARAVAALDTDTRAWVVGVALLEELAGPVPIPVGRVLERAIADGTFPSGPFAVAPGEVDVELAADGRSAEATLEVAGERSYQARAGLDGRGVSAALTRSGLLDDGSVEPTHVMLSDVESVLVDIVAIAESLAAEIGYFGAVRVMVGIACAVPGQNLELRVYDELCGDNLRPAAGYTHFEPIVLDYPGRLDEAAAEALRWENAVRIAHAFGVFLPQLVGQARAISTISYRPSPHAG
ncbi:MAG: hypothetical protein M9891_03960 [Austwickia sp.]|nr:hypothetical protein [Austwickia sp.]MCO5308440.1 hypothetical protein [Austwickia sp.]